MPVATTRETQVEGDYIHISKEPASDDDQRDDVDVESFVQLVNEKGEFTYVSIRAYCMAFAHCVV